MRDKNGIVHIRTNNNMYADSVSIYASFYEHCLTVTKTIGIISLIVTKTEKKKKRKMMDESWMTWDFRPFQHYFGHIRMMSG